MNQDPNRPMDIEMQKVVDKYMNVLFRLCYIQMKNHADAEDAVSETWIRYMKKAPEFTGEEHRKAWLLRTATNICRDMQRYYKRHRYVNLDDLKTYVAKEEDRTIVESLMSLPEKYKTVLYLYYIEGYKTAEISEMLSISTFAVRKRLQIGRKKLKMEYEQEEPE